MTCTELDELLGAYVLDAVTPEERTEIEAHLALCPQCQKSLKEMQKVIDLLPLSVPEVTPTPQLKNRIMAAIEEVENTSTLMKRNLQPLLLRQQGRFVPASQLPASETAASAPIPLRRRATVTQRLVLSVAMAAAMLFLILSGTLYAQVISLQHQVSGLQASVVQTSSFTLSGTQGASGVANYIHGNGLDVTIMTVHGLPTLKDQEVYQGWVIKDGVTKSLGLLVSHNNGSATISIPGSVKGNDALAVSLEKGPSATPNTPKGQVLVVGKIPSKL